MSITNTPWGRPDTVKEIADGITFVSTPSHGGYILSEERMRDFGARVTIHFQPFAGYGYFEEDCDWSAVALAFPEFFPVQHLVCAIETVRAMADVKRSPSLPDIAQRWAPLASWLTETAEGRALVRRAYPENDVTS